jgi:hypothetical protein
MAHKCYIEPPVAHILQPREARLKRQREGGWARAGVFGAEIEVAAEPLAVKLDDVIELVSWWWWLNVLGAPFVQQSFGFLGELGF